MIYFLKTGLRRDSQLVIIMRYSAANTRTFMQPKRYREPWIKFVGTCHLQLNLWLQKLAETLWSLWPVEQKLPGVPLWIIFTNKKMIPATGVNLRKVRLAFCRFSSQMTERWQIHCSETHSPCRATSCQVLLARHRCSLANASGRVEFYTPVIHTHKHTHAHTQTHTGYEVCALHGKHMLKHMLFRPFSLLQTSSPDHCKLMWKPAYLIRHIFRSPTDPWWRREGAQA